MAKKIIHVDPARFGNLHCDSCGYDSPRAVSQAEFESGTLTGTPCPHCDADMLTESDWLASMKLLRLVALINRWFGWLGTYEFTEENSGTVGVRIHDGELTVRRTREPGQPRARR